jgi:hypothetical protein
MTIQIALREWDWLPDDACGKDSHGHQSYAAA